MKLSWLTRRNQTALFAVTPAQGSDEGSVTVTATVLPIWKSSGLPSVTHFSGTFRKNGATINPTNGPPTIAVHRPTSAAMKRTTPTNQTTQMVINPQKRKATPIANPAGKYVGWGKGVSGSICQPGGTASECCVVGCSLGI